jgi:hypothetical protein
MPGVSRTTLNTKTGIAYRRKQSDLKKMADETVAAVVPAAEVVVEKDELTLAREKLAKTEEERDNYKAVALKRLGKLPGDAEFLDKEGSGELSVAEQVRLALLDREVEGARKEREGAEAKLIKENSELRIALKNQPGSSLGGSGSGTSTEVKDNVFSEAQLVELRKKAERLHADPEKFIEQAKANILARR